MAMGIFGLGQALGLTFTGLLGEIIGGLFGEGAVELIKIALDRHANRLVRQLFAEEIEGLAQLNGVEEFLGQISDEIKRDAVEKYLARHGKISESKQLKIEEKAMGKHTKELIEVFYDRISGIGADFFAEMDAFRDPANEPFFDPFLKTVNEARELVLQFKFGRLEEDDKVMAGMIVSSLRKIVHEEISENLSLALSQQICTVFAYADGCGVGEIAQSRDPLKWLPRQCPNCHCTDPAYLRYNDARREIFCASCQRTYFAVENTDGMGELLNAQTQQIVARLEGQGMAVTAELRDELRSGFASAVTKEYLERSLKRFDERGDELLTIVGDVGDRLLGGLAAETQSVEALREEVRAAAQRTESGMRQTASLIASMEEELRALRENGTPCGYDETDKLLRETYARLGELLELWSQSADREKYERAQEQGRELKEAEETIARLREENAALRENAKTLSDKRGRRAYDSRERTLRSAAEGEARRIDRIHYEVQCSVQEELDELRTRLKGGSEKYRDELIGRMQQLFSPDDPAYADAAEAIDDAQNILCFLNANMVRLDPSLPTAGTEELWRFMKERTAQIEERSRVLAETVGPMGKIEVCDAIEEYMAQLKEKLQIA